MIMITGFFVQFLEIRGIICNKIDLDDLRLGTQFDYLGHSIFLISTSLLTTFSSVTPTISFDKFLHVFKCFILRKKK